ncbi:hypothetical protein POSPLADRAFT_1058111 [Postia placenta MAD-698-R-SB12]|uniref:AMP-dependent synthetase/ligase domain-containing protein n=1 Tax=Postia placenta MAD-698-R-SB12 TaxID=670580 RepID=A0A1X6MYA6_9APHY|nr:hypothetical protein POSPLADRAFT_1058111 [Postia placenta MAD-698-R-SB12]OSX61183.1 hypothetical protein POSPLADRAFT_1058111 [Postia placenta MAD-698-R-SB12]
MVSSLRTHLTVLAQSAFLYPSAPAFRVPVIDHRTNQIKSWTVISYSQFQSDVELFATYWSRTLAADGLAQRSVVGLWLGGLTYMDVLHIYGIARAGYVPQLFSLKLPNPDIIYELLHKANARALIYDAAYVPALSGCHVPVHAAVDVHGVDLRGARVPAMTDLGTVKRTDTIMMFHTSGSTSGSPKLIPCSYGWLDAIITKAGQVSKPISSNRQDVTVFIGSMCHIGQTFMFLGSLQHGACTVQPTEITFSSCELVDMIARCGLNRLNQFPAFLGVHLRNSRKDPQLLARLCALDEILYSGQPMAAEDEAWAYKHGMKMVNLFGSTECGAMLLSTRGSGHANPPLRPMVGTKYGFLSISLSSPSSAATSAHTNAHAQLVELVILADSPDCPDPSLRAADGHYHTGDLFVEVAPGAYVSRGRNDDWIKSSTALRCDTKAIEDNVRATCGDLVAECIVVGNGRPSPVVFVEALVAMDAEKLRREIVRRTRQFHARRYVHERITSARMVVVVGRGTLPRTATKGNIRRRVVEDMFKVQLDEIFAS